MNSIFKKRFLILILLVAILLSLRLSLLLFTFNRTWCEEGVRGIAAKHLLEGVRTQSIFDYFQPYEGGSVLISYLAVPFIYLFGVSIFSLRLAPLFISMMILVALYIFMEWFFNRKAAVLACLLYIFAPPTYTRYSSYCIGNHGFAVLFDMLILLVFFRAFFLTEDRPPSRNYLYLMLLGFLSGLAAYACFSSLILLSGILLFWYIFDKLFFIRKQFFLFALFFILGISPLIYFTLSHWSLILNNGWYNPLNYLRITGLGHGWSGASSFLSKMAYVFLQRLPGSFNFDFFMLYPRRAAWDYFYFLLLIASLLYLLWSQRRSLAAIAKGLLPLRRFNAKPRELDHASVLVILAGLYVPLSLLTDYTSKEMFEPRYFFYFYPRIFIFIALFLVGWFNAGRIRRACAAVLASAVIAMGVIGNLGLLGEDDHMAIKTYEALDFLRGEKIKYIYTLYNYKWPFAFESNEEVIPSGEGIWNCNAERTVIFDDNKVGNHYYEYEKMVDRAVGDGMRYAYLVNDGRDNGFGHYFMLEDYMKENRIEYKKVSLASGFAIYYDFSRAFKSAEVNFKRRWEEKYLKSGARKSPAGG